jgi:hypothetical protein
MAGCLVICADIIADLIEHIQRQLYKLFVEICSIIGQETADIVADLVRSVVK